MPDATLLPCQKPRKLRNWQSRNESHRLSNFLFRVPQALTQVTLIHLLRQHQAPHNLRNRTQAPAEVVAQAMDEVRVWLLETGEVETRAEVLGASNSLRLKLRTMLAPIKAATLCVAVVRVTVDQAQGTSKAIGDNRTITTITIPKPLRRTITSSKVRWAISAWGRTPLHPLSNPDTVRGDLSISPWAPLATSNIPAKTRCFNLVLKDKFLYNRNCSALKVLILSSLPSYKRFNR
jgi:hypothetical protein